jgi:hypothetical protein
MFQNTITEAIPEIDISLATTAVNYMFANSAVKIIRKLKVSEQVQFTTATFQSCRALENIIIDGTIGQNGLDLH